MSSRCFPGIPFWGSISYCPNIHSMILSGYEEATPQTFKRTNLMSVYAEQLIDGIAPGFLHVFLSGFLEIFFQGFLQGFLVVRIDFSWSSFGDSFRDSYRILWRNPFRIPSVIPSLIVPWVHSGIFPEFLLGFLPGFFIRLFRECWQGFLYYSPQDSFEDFSETSVQISSGISPLFFLGFL